MALLASTPARPESISIQDAIRTARNSNPALRAAHGAVRAAQADADAARHGWLPSLEVTARAVRTDEPLMAFGLRLDQGQVAPQDFDPARLNHPDALTGFGAGAHLTLPIYAGGRISAGRRATSAQAGAMEATWEERQNGIALGVVEAYFGTEAAEQGLQYAEDLLSQARETERFVRLRNQQGLMLDADAARATAFRAQAEAERAAADQRVASARSALVLLVGPGAAGATLSTPLEPPSGAVSESGDASARPSVRAAQHQREAAEAATAIALGSLLPSVGAQAAVDTARNSSLGAGNTWFTVGLAAQWNLSLGDHDRLRAAEARAAAASDALEWERSQAQRDLDEARHGLSTAQARITSAQEAMTASEEAVRLRRSRHEQGLLPLTDVLEAQSALAGARALLLQARLEMRLARARLSVALGQPVEGE
jgi:outer membrane protein TolC